MAISEAEKPTQEMKDAHHHHRQSSDDDDDDVHVCR